MEPEKLVTKMTRDEVSDLQSLIDRVRHTSKALRDAQTCHDFAENALQNWLRNHTDYKATR